MEIISFKFFVFVIATLIVYYIVPKKIKWIVLLAFSLIFICLIDIKYLFFFGFAILTSYFAAIIINKINKRKILILVTAIILNAGLLIFLKYYNWFNDSVLAKIGLNEFGLELIIPIGISYYTLQIIGYIIDVYRGKSPERNIFKYATFVMFFPQLFQGPISRASDLLPQITEEHRLSYENITRGGQLILWGLFKKLVIADWIAPITSSIFDGFSTQTFGSEVAFGAIAFAIQLYMDFSGCTDIIRGCGELFGIELPINFKHPYFATSIDEFWRCWHISLTSWFKDYLYIPLGGNKKGKARQYINIMIIFIISGFWHGAGFKYLIWGTLHGLYQIIGRVLKPVANKVLFKLKIKTKTFGFRFLQATGVSILVSFAWIFFRAPSTLSALEMVKAIFTRFNFGKLINNLYSYGVDYKHMSMLFIFIIGVVVLEYIQKKKEISIREKIKEQPLLFRWLIYLGVGIIILVFGYYGPGLSPAAFIYQSF